MGALNECQFQCLKHLVVRCGKKRVLAMNLKFICTRVLPIPDEILLHKAHQLHTNVMQNAAFTTANVISKAKPQLSCILFSRNLICTITLHYNVFT